VKYFILLLIPVAAFSNSFPFGDDGLRIFFDGAALQTSGSPIFDSISGIEVLRQFHRLQFRAKIQSATFYDLQLQYEASAGFKLANSWIMGINAAAIPEVSKKVETGFRFGTYISYKDENFQAYLEPYFNGDFSWGCLLRQTIFVPLKFEIRHSWSSPGLELNLKPELFENIFVQIQYDIILKSFGFGVDIKADQGVFIEVNLPHLFFNKGEFHAGLALTYFFRPDDSEKKIEAKKNEP